MAIPLPRSPLPTQEDLVAIKDIKAYGVGRTKAFEKINERSPGYDPTFPNPLIIGRKYFFVRAEMLQWALQQRRSARGNQ